MASANRKWIPPALIAAALIASFVAYGNMPASVTLDLAGLLPFDVADDARPGPRWVAAFLIPAVTLLVWAGLRWATTAGGERFAKRLFPRAPESVTSAAQFERFGKSYDAIVLAVVLLLLGFHAAFLAAALGAPALAVRIVPAVLGASLILMGNVMPRLRPNWVAGARTTRILSDPQLWRDTHRVMGAAFVASGLATLVTAVAAPRYGMVVGIGALVISCLVVLVASTGFARRDPAH